MQLRVLQALNKWEKRQFGYGDADCCQFTGFVVKELTGKDYLADFHYTSEEQAEQIIKTNGDLKSTVSSALGDPTEGDLTDGSPVLVDLLEGEALGIKLGKFAVCLVKKGFVRIPEESIITGWDLCRL